MDIPKNCNECPHTETCPAPHYGADGCKHEEKINQSKGREHYEFEKANLY